MEAATGPEHTQKCSKSTCNSTVPNGKSRLCDKCREIQRLSKRRNRAKQKDKENETVSHKRPHDGDNTHNQSPKRSRAIGEDDTNSQGVTTVEDVDDNYEDCSAYRIYDSPEECYKALRDTATVNTTFEFKGRYVLVDNGDVLSSDRVKMAASEVWKTTGWRFTVRDNPKIQSGHSTRYWCCQDEDRVKAAKPTQTPGAKHREHVGMKRFPCKSTLTISCRSFMGSTLVTMRLRHCMRHMPYYDVGMPDEVADKILEQVEWLKPATMVPAIQAEHPEMTSAQIYRAWQTATRVFWHRHDDQLKSARLLLEEYHSEVDVFDVRGVPEGVEILAWGVKDIASRLKESVNEIGVDATYNTNQRHLELYTIMAEYDNSGFPLSYCLLSTATAIDQLKRMTSLTAWAKCVRDTYKVNPIFAHVDKDMAEIGCLKVVWPGIKISLCLWHLLRAVKTRLSKAKVETTPYNAARAKSEFAFVDIAFVPPNQQADIEDYEGGLPDDILASSAQEHTNSPTDSLTIKIPAPTQPATQNRLVIRLPARPGTQPEESHQHIEDTPKPRDRRTFCPSEYREAILKMMERHYCAHPSIPGYSAPSADAIRRHSVHQTYTLCHQNDLPEVWAYLWENWYRTGRWELWARSAHAEIPVLRTTMMIEGHWRKIKHDFLEHFHLPRCDLLAWVLVKKMLPTFYRKLGNLMVDKGRYRELASWRKDFKKGWRELERREVNTDMVDTYRPNVLKWTCTCPAFFVSRFLICKHLVQRVHRVPPVFFLEAKRARSAPFWSHPSLKPLDPTGGDDELNVAAPQEPPSSEFEDGEGGEEPWVDDNDESEDEGEGLWGKNSGSTFEEEMNELINMLTEFGDGLRYQIRFRDQRFLRGLAREGRSFFRLAEACLGKENRRKATGTWEQSVATAMFYHARPAGTSTATELS